MHDRDLNDDHVQHGIDNNPNNDPQKGAAIGGVGGAVVGATAGAAAGPVGAVIGAVIGGVAGAAASGAAVAAVDQMDDDDTLTGIGDHESHATRDTYDDDTTGTYAAGTTTDNYAGTYTPAAGAIGTASHADAVNNYGSTPMDVTDNATAGNLYQGTANTGSLANDRFGDGIGNDVPGVQTGGRAIDGTPDTRGITEKVSDAVTGDHVDDKTGRIV